MYLEYLISLVIGIAYCVLTTHVNLKCNRTILSDAIDREMGYKDKRKEDIAIWSGINFHKEAWVKVVYPENITFCQWQLEGYRINKI